jgi:hypothetical protein
MSLFNQMLRGSASCEPIGYDNPKGLMNTAQPRTFLQTIDDQIAYHSSKIRDLQEVKDSLSPEVLKFVEAIQRIG